MMTDEKQSKWKRKQQRRGYTIQLIEGEDSALITWLDKMTSSERAKAMREALYNQSGLEMPPPPEALYYQALQQELTGTAQALQQELTATQQALRGELDSVKQSIGVTAQTAQTAQQELTSVKDEIKRDIQAELAPLKSAITRSQSIAPAAGSDPDTVERIDYLHRWLERITAELPKFVDDRIARLVPDGFVSGVQPGADFMGDPEPQRVDPAELEKRGRRIKAATW